MVTFNNPNLGRAAKTVAASFGILSGLGGITHGVGEVLQGNITTNSLVIHSWTEGAIATNMGGEPALTILPNLLLTGIVTIIISTLTIIWSGRYISSKYGGQILVLFSIGMLLVGGGFGPPIMGILAGVAGLGTKPHKVWLTRLSASVRRLFTTLWPWVYIICLLNGIFLVVGSVVLVYFFDLNNPDLFVNSFFFAILSLLFTIFTGAAYDAERLRVVPN